MKKRESASYNKITFEDEGMKIIIRPELTSWVDGGDDYSGFFHEELEIKYFYQGSCTLLVDDKIIKAEAGDLIFINPYKIHSTVSLGEQKGKYHLVMLGLDFFPSSADFLNLRQMFTERKTGISSVVKGNARIKRIFEELVDEWKNKDDLYNVAVKGLVSELFAVLFRDYSVQLEKDDFHHKSISKYSTVIPALNMIQSSYAKHITIDELADSCNVTKYHFCRVFKDCLGMTALEYLLHYRLRIADIILENTDKSIAETAMLCGFEDAAYFSRCYKKINGKPPKTKRAILSK